MTEKEFREKLKELAVSFEKLVFEYNMEASLGNAEMFGSQSTHGDATILLASIDCSLQCRNTVDLRSMLLPTTLRAVVGNHDANKQIIEEASITTQYSIGSGWTIAHEWDDPEKPLF